MEVGKRKKREEEGELIGPAGMGAVGFAKAAATLGSSWVSMAA